MVDEPSPRSRAARDAAENALARVVRHYGGRPEFVVLGGLVPELLCAGSEFNHAGTTDIDVQVDLEIACGAVNAARLEKALRNAGFEPEDPAIWRWVADGTAGTQLSNLSCWPTSMTNRRKRRSRLKRVITSVP